MNKGLSDRKGFGGATCSKAIGDMPPALVNDEQLTCTSPPKLLFSDEEEESSQTGAAGGLLSLYVRETFDGGGAGGREDDSSSSAEWERPVSFWTSAMKSRACVWITLGEWV